MTKEVKTVTIDGLAYLFEADHEKVVKRFKAAGIEKFKTPHDGAPELRPVTYDEAFVLFSKSYLGHILNIKSQELNVIIRENGISFSNRADIVRVLDDEVVSVKVRLKKLRGAFIDWVEKAPAPPEDEEVGEERDTGEPDGQEHDDAPGRFADQRGGTMENDPGPPGD